MKNYNIKLICLIFLQPIILVFVFLSAFGAGYGGRVGIVNYVELGISFILSIFNIYFSLKSLGYKIPTETIILRFILFIISLVSIILLFNSI